MRFPFFRNRDSVKNGILISIRRTGDGFHPGLFICGLAVDMHGGAALLLILLDVVAELRVHKWFFFGETAFFKILCPKELLIHSVPKKLFADMLEIGHPL